MSSPGSRSGSCPAARLTDCLDRGRVQLHGCRLSPEGSSEEYTEGPVAFPLQHLAHRMVVEHVVAEGLGPCRAMSVSFCAGRPRASSGSPVSSLPYSWPRPPPG